jgi:hypothetical protein
MNIRWDPQVVTWERTDRQAEQDEAMKAHFKILLSYEYTDSMRFSEGSEVRAFFGRRL